MTFLLSPGSWIFKDFAVSNKVSISNCPLFIRTSNLSAILNTLFSLSYFTFYRFLNFTMHFWVYFFHPTSLAVYGFEGNDCFRFDLKGRGEALKSLTPHSKGWTLIFIAFLFSLTLIDFHITGVMIGSHLEFLDIILLLVLLTELPLLFFNCLLFRAPLNGLLHFSFLISYLVSLKTSNFHSSSQYALFEP